MQVGFVCWHSRYKLFAQAKSGRPTASLISPSLMTNLRPRSENRGIRRRTICSLSDGACRSRFAMSPAVRQWMATGDSGDVVSKSTILVCDWPTCCELGPSVKVAVPMSHTQLIASQLSEPWCLLLSFQLFFRQTIDNECLRPLFRLEAQIPQRQQTTLDDSQSILSGLEGADLLRLPSHELLRLVSTLSGRQNEFLVTFCRQMLLETVLNRIYKDQTRIAIQGLAGFEQVITVGAQANAVCAESGCLVHSNRFSPAFSVHIFDSRSTGITLKAVAGALLSFYSPFTLWYADGCGNKTTSPCASGTVIFTKKNVARAGPPGDPRFFCLVRAMFPNVHARLRHSQPREKTIQCANEKNAVAVIVTTPHPVAARGVLWLFCG